MQFRRKPIEIIYGFFSRAQTSFYSLEAAVECASNANPFAGLGEDLPFGRENTYRLGLSFSQTLFSGGRVSGQASAAAAGVRRAELGLTAAQAQLLQRVARQRRVLADPGPALAPDKAVLLDPVSQPRPLRRSAARVGLRGQPAPGEQHVEHA